MTSSPQQPSRSSADLKRWFDGVFGDIRGILSRYDDPHDFVEIAEPISFAAFRDYIFADPCTPVPKPDIQRIRYYLHWFVISGQRYVAVSSEGHVIYHPVPVTINDEGVCSLSR